MNSQINRFPTLSGTLSMMISEMAYRAVLGIGRVARMFERAIR